MKRVLLLVLVACGRPVEIDRPIDTVRPVEQPATPEAIEAKPVEVTTLAPPTRHGSTRFTRTLSDTTTLIDLLLDSTSVFCTALGYGSVFLKVSIPQLDQLAHFDHRVEGTNLPCAAVGECSDEMNADNILQHNPGTEQVSIRVVLVERVEIDWDAVTCQRQLVEDVSATIRGVPVRHHVEGKLEASDFNACAATAPEP